MIVALAASRGVYYPFSMSQYGLVLAVLLVLHLALAQYRMAFNGQWSMSDHQCSMSPNARYDELD